MIRKILWLLFWVTLVIAGATFAYWLWTHPAYLTWEFWQSGRDGVIQSSRSEVVRNLALLAIGAIGLGFGIWRAWLATKHQRSIEEGQITERFTKAVELLGSDQLAVRQGAIHALWRIAEDSPDRDYPKVFDVLCTYVRHPKIESKTIENKTIENKLPPPDTITIIELFSERPIKFQRIERKNSFRFSINRESRMDEKVVKFTFGYLQRLECVKNMIDLSNSNLRGVNFQDVHFHGADFHGADLSDADFSESNFEDSIMIRTDLSEAVIRNATFGNADLTEAKLIGTDFFASNMENVDFLKADATYADFTDTELLFADFTDTNLSGATFNVESDYADALGHGVSSGWAFINEQPRVTHGELFKDLKLVHPKHRSYQNGYPHKAPSNGMTKEEISTYWAEQEDQNKEGS